MAVPQLEAAGNPCQHAGSTKLSSHSTIPSANWQSRRCNRMARLLPEVAQGEQAVQGVCHLGNLALHGHSTKLVCQLTTWSTSSCSTPGSLRCNRMGVTSSRAAEVVVV